MLDSDMEVNGILCTSLSEICKPGSRCSSNESGYYDYVPSFDLEPFNRNTLQTTTTSSDILPLDNMIPHQWQLLHLDDSLTWHM